MKNKRRLPYNIYVFLAAYIALIALLIVSVFSMQKWLQQTEIKYTASVQQAIAEIFTSTNEKDLPEAFITFREDEYPIEIIIQTQNGKSVYQSIPYVTLNEARGLIPTKAAVLETRGEIEGKDKTYVVWYTIYRPTMEEYLKNLFTLQMTLTIIAFMLLIAITYYLYRRLIKPLTAVKQTLTKLEHYDLDTIDLTPEDEITEGMQRFAISLKDNITTVSRNHTKLEYALQLERERLQNMITVSRGIIHDLKSPLYQTMLENESLLRTRELGKETEAVIHYNVERLDTMMQQITEVLNLMSTNVQEMMDVKDDFDFAQMVKEIRHSFIPLLEEKELWLTTDMPETMPVHVNKVASRLIVHNMLTNAIQYAIPDSEINFIMYEEAGELHVICENESTARNIERINNSDSLFQATEQDAEHVYSTGNGLYLIRELTTISNGVYEIEVNEGMVLIHVTLPL